MYKAGKVSFEHVVTFNMDEYCDIPKTHPGSYHHFMWENLFKVRQAGCQAGWLPARHCVGPGAVLSDRDTAAGGAVGREGVVILWVPLGDCDSGAAGGGSGVGGPGSVGEVEGFEGGDGGREGGVIFWSPRRYSRATSRAALSHF